MAAPSLDEIADRFSGDGVGSVLVYTHEAHPSERRRAKERLAPFGVARLDFRAHDQEAFFEGLERNSPEAMREFREAFG